MIGTPLCSVTLGHDYDMHFCILVASKKGGWSSGVVRRRHSIPAFGVTRLTTG